MGPGADDVVPPRRGDAARPQGGPAAAPGRRRGRGGPRAARGARPALRTAAAVQGVQAGRRRPPDPAGGGVEASPARGGAGGALRDPAARGAHRHRPRPVRGARRQGPRAEGRARGLPPAHPRRSRQRARAGGADGRAAAAQRHDDLPGPVRRLTRHPDHGGAVPGPARAVPRGRGRLRPGHPARRADRPLDRRRGRGRRVPHRRVRGSTRTASRTHDVPEEQHP